MLGSFMCNIFRNHIKIRVINVFHAGQNFQHSISLVHLSPVIDLMANIIDFMLISGGGQ